MTIDVEALFADNEARLEHLYSDGGVLPALFARLGVYAFHPIDESYYHDWKSQGWPVYRMRKDRVALDPTLRFDEYAMLVPCGPSIRKVIAKHPSTPRDVAAQLKTMTTNELLDLSLVRQTPLPRIEDTRSTTM